jgi:hypothetical protein
MMKKMKIAAIALAVLMSMSVFAPASAIGLFGQWQDSKDAGSGYGLGIKQDWSIVPIVSIEGRFSWLRYSDDEWNDDLDMFPLEAFGKFKLGMFYGGVGLGYYFMSGEFAPKDSFGGFAAIGLDFSLGIVGAFGELRYLYLEPEYEDVDVTADMSGIGANLGITIGF